MIEHWLQNSVTFSKKNFRHCLKGISLSNPFPLCTGIQVEEEAGRKVGDDYKEAASSRHSYTNECTEIGAAHSRPEQVETRQSLNNGRGKWA